MTEILVAYQDKLEGMLSALAVRRSYGSQAMFVRGAPTVESGIEHIVLLGEVVDAKTVEALSNTGKSVTLFIAKGSSPYHYLFEDGIVSGTHSNRESLPEQVWHFYHGHVLPDLFMCYDQMPYLLALQAIGTDPAALPEWDFATTTAGMKDLTKHGQMIYNYLRRYGDVRAQEREDASQQEISKLRRQLREATELNVALLEAEQQRRQAAISTQAV